MTAVAADSVGNATTSAAAVVFVNQPPAVSVTAPAAGAVFQPAAPVPLSASASDAEGSVTNVEFYDGTADLGPAALVNGSYTLAWAGASAGTHSVTAVATDNHGGVATSAAVSLRVDAPPVVSVTGPAPLAVFQPGAPLALTAAATDADGTVANVEFFDGATDLGPAVLANGAYRAELDGRRGRHPLGHRRRHR